MVGIAIINYNKYEKTIECIDSIRKTTNIPYKVYLIDNGSNNESGKILSEKYSDSNDVEVILSEDNLGYAKGNNICIDRMFKDGCDYGVISNNDIICTKDSIELLINTLVDNPKYLLVGPKILSPTGKNQKSIILKQYGKLEYLKKNTYLYKLNRKSINKEINEIEKIIDFCRVSWVSAAFFAFDIKKMIQVEKFDPNTFLFFEEYILATKASNHGFVLGYNPNAKVIHDHGFTTGGGVNINSKIAADQSEYYYINKFSKNGIVFLAILRVVRKMEVLFTFGKRKEFSSIHKYSKEIKQYKKKLKQQ